MTAEPFARDIQVLLDNVAARHRHLCPRQVLGVRIGLAGAHALGLDAPRTDRRLLVIVETDGCFADGVSVATGAVVGRRTLRVVDYGKVAATVIDVRTEAAVRVRPRDDSRERAAAFAPGERRRYFAQLAGYRLMPDEELLLIHPVQTVVPVGRLLSRSGVRARCAACGEEIINEREVWRGDIILCRGCAEPPYYVSAAE